MSAAWEYLNKVAEDADVPKNESLADHRRHCRAKRRCPFAPPVNHTYKFEAWGVNSCHEEIETTAPSFEKAVMNARYRGANKILRLQKNVNLRWLEFDGRALPKNVIIDGYANIRTDKDVKSCSNAVKNYDDRHRSGTGDAGGGGGQAPGGDACETHEQNGNGGVSQEVQGESCDGGDEVVGDGRVYLKETIAEDAWIESGTGNLFWKAPARKRPIDRLSRRRVHEIISENVGLIKSIEKDMLPDVAVRVYKVLNGGYDPFKFVDWMIDECGVSEGRAYLIASDQIRKARERCKIEDWKSRGVKYAVWRHKDGEQDPRDYHIRKWDGKSGIRSGKPNGLDGFIFDLDKPPVIDRRTGERGYPSTLPGCRCYIVGVRA